MHMSIKPNSCLQACLLLFFLAGGLFSCELPERPEEKKPEEDTEKPIVRPPQRDEALPFQQEILLTQIIPELESNSYIQEDKNGFFIPLGKQTCSETFTIDSFFLPEQVSEPVFLKAEQVSARARTWNLRSTGILVVSLVLPEGCEDLESAECQATFRLHFSLDDNSPFRKVTLSKISVQFPDWLKATPVEGSIPNMVLTKEGKDVEFNLTGMNGARNFVGEDGKFCISAETSFSASVSADMTDARDPVAEPPASVRLKCTFESGRIDFTNCYLIYSKIEFPRKEMIGEPIPLPSFLSGLGSEINTEGPQVLVHYSENLPFTNTMEGSFPDLQNSSPFYLHSSGNYLLMSKADSWYRPGIETTSISALREIFRKPAQDGTLTPKMAVRPFISGSDVFATPSIGVRGVPGKEYRMDVEAEWSFPLFFSGKMTGISYQTETLHLDGDELNAPGDSTHEIGMTLKSGLPFDCVATPVFTLEGNDPVFLDDVYVTGYYGGPWFHHAFTPGKDHWKASLYFIITPAKFVSVQFDRSQNMVLKDALFTANLRDKE